MVKDTYPERHSTSHVEVKINDPTDVELYDQCFTLESPVRVTKLEPRVIFAKVIRQIDAMQLTLRPTTPREAAITRGYVFAIHEADSDFVTIGHGGRIVLDAAVGLAPGGVHAHHVRLQGQGVRVVGET